MIWVDRERDRLYASIDARVDKMVEMGLLEEVKNWLAVDWAQTTLLWGQWGMRSRCVI